MAVLIWPSDLPPFVLRDGYAETLDDGRKKIETDSGFDFLRLESPGFEQVAASIYVPQERVPRFKRFWKVETKKGTRPFVVSDQLLDGKMILDASGEPILIDDAPLLVVAKWLARFAPDQAPRIEPHGVRFQISMQLEILPLG
ncbi:MAG TPA: hypothetical protein VIF40_18215 [Methylosinus sp.]|jgi:hypothetical protein|uniref:hypothetical protein n=1 Tax=Methylosinus sp. TaxID=427 RepID=UPI002F9591F3